MLKISHMKTPNGSAADRGRACRILGERVGIRLEGGTAQFGQADTTGGPDGDDSVIRRATLAQADAQRRRPVSWRQGHQCGTDFRNYGMPRIIEYEEKHS